MKNRCKWVNLENKNYIDYHDKELGEKVFDDKKLFEMLVLESFQAGLSWECILNKRQSFEETFDNFDVIKVSDYDDKKVMELMANKNIIRNKLKILAVINNAKVFIKIQKEYKSFCNYIWHFTNNQVIYEEDKTKSLLSLEISNDLKKEE